MYTTISHNKTVPPLVSVIIPTFNRAHMIKKTIESVLEQSFEDWELIIVDDASSDNTEEIVQNYIKNDSRLSYIRHDMNMGGSAARNSGIGKSNGNFIALLDDDDRWHPDKLKLQINLFNKYQDSGLIYSGFNYVDYITGTVIKKVMPEYQGNLKSVLLKKNIIGSPTPLIKKECFKYSGLFDVNLFSCQDWDMWLRISMSHTFRFVNESLADVTMHGRQISSDLKSKIKSRQQIIVKHYDELKKYPSILSYHYKRLAALYTLDHSQTNAIKNISRSFQQQPYNPENLLHFFLAFLPPIYRLLLKRFGSILRSNDVIFYN